MGNQKSTARLLKAKAVPYKFSPEKLPTTTVFKQNKPVVKRINQKEEKIKEMERQLEINKRKLLNKQLKLLDKPNR